MCNFAPNDKQPMNKQDWTYKKLGEVCDFQGGSQPPKEEWIDEYKEGYIRMLQIRDFTQSRAFTKEYIKITNRIKTCKKDDILIGRYGASVGKILTGEEGAYNVAIMKTIPDESIISKDYAKLFFQSPSFQHFLQSVCNSRAAQAGFSKSDISDYLIPVPPIGEQERIVAELDLLSGIIEKKKEQLKAYDQLAQSIFYTMFGDPIDNPKGWETKTIGNTCTITCGQDYKTVEDENGKYPIYGTGGIMGWANQFRCPKDSVIIGRKGNINNPILVNADFWNVDTAFGVTPNNDVLSAIYFFFFCKEYDFTQHDVSVTIPSLRRTDILKIKLPVPPLSLQEEFAEKVEAIERQKALVQQSIEETQTMFDYTMDKYFG